MRDRVLTLVAAVATSLFLSCAALPPASAQVPVRVSPGGGGSRLMVGSKVVAILRTANGDTSPERRAQIAAERLAELLDAGLTADQVDARPRGDAWGVYARGTLIMIATAEEAAQRREDPETTARRWAANLKLALAAAGEPEPPKAGAKPRVPQNRLLAENAPAGKKGRRGKREKPRPAPTLTVADKSVAIPVGEVRTVELQGTAQGPIFAETDNRETAVVEPVPGKPELAIRGAGPGKAVIHVSREGKDLYLTAWVKKYAGRVADTPLAQVTGLITPGSLVAQLAREHALEGIVREPEAVARIDGEPVGCKALPRGDTLDVEVPVVISGEAYLPVRTTAKVRVTNVALPAAETRTLLYSNDPESVRAHGTLFQGLVSADGPTRLLYHHQNRIGAPFVFQIHLVNPNDEPADVQVLGGDAGPFIDPIQVGHRAGERYMSALMSDVGYITRVPARGSLNVTAIKVPQLDTVSGLYNFRVLAGGTLVVHVAAVSALSPPGVSEALLNAARNEPHTYSTPQKSERYAYHCGDPWTFMRLGRKPISGNGAKRQLFGNYGVLYNMVVEVDNPTQQEQTVRVVLQPDAGSARGVFLIEGKLIEAPQVSPPAEAELWKFKLAPQQKRRIFIQGMPVGGSFYPISLVVRS